MAPHQLVESTFECLAVERADLVNRDHFVVDGIVGRQLAEVPQLLLRDRQRDRSGLPPRRHDARVAIATRLAAQSLFQESTLRVRKMFAVRRHA